MNPQLLSFFRTVFKVLGTYLASRGYTDNSGAEEFAGGALLLIGLAWSHFTHADLGLSDSEKSASNRATEGSPLNGDGLRVVGWVLCNVALTLAAAALLMGCAHIDVSSVTLDPGTQAAVTNRARGTFFLSKSSVDKLEVATRTKTTSKLIGAAHAEESGDVEMVKALAEAFGQVAAAAAKAAVKP